MSELQASTPRQPQRAWWLPDIPPLSHSEKLVSAAAAILAMLLLSWFTARYFGGHALPFMVASMGASSVLLFSAPHSPLAHPWSFAGGHLLSALVGVTAVTFIPDLTLAAACAVGGAVLVMLVGRCLHPPGGATALFAVLGGEAVTQAGYGFLLVPVGVNVLGLLVLALIINNLIPGRYYPPGLRRVTEPLTESWPFGQFRLARDDLEAALKGMDSYIDVSETDLARIFSLAMQHAHTRRLGEIYCSDIMSTDVPALEYGDTLETAWAIMREGKHKGLPVIDRSRRVIGIVTIIDFLKRVDVRTSQPVFLRLTRLIRRTLSDYSDKPEVVGQIMTAPAVTVAAQAHIATLVPLFAANDIHHIPVVDAERRLAGVVTQSHLVGALYGMKTKLS